MPEGLKVEVLLEDTKYQDNLMKKYKLQDLVSNGSHSRLKVDSDLLVGDIKNGYGYGDVLDANATKQVSTNIAEMKVNAAKQELIELINKIEGVNTDQDEKDAQILEQIQQIIYQINNSGPTIGGDNDNLIFS